MGRHHLNKARALSDVDKSLVTWLTETCPAIYLKWPDMFNLQRNHLDPFHPPKQKKRFN